MTTYRSSVEYYNYPPSSKGDVYLVQKENVRPAAKGISLVVPLVFAGFFLGGEEVEYENQQLSVRRELTMCPSKVWYDIY